MELGYIRKIDVWSGVKLSHEYHFQSYFAFFCSKESNTRICFFLSFPFFFFFFVFRLRTLNRWRFIFYKKRCIIKNTCCFSFSTGIRKLFWRDIKFVIGSLSVGGIVKRDESSIRKKNKRELQKRFGKKKGRRGIVKVAIWQFLLFSFRPNVLQV